MIGLVFVSICGCWCDWQDGNSGVPELVCALVDGGWHSLVFRLLCCAGVVCFVRQSGLAPDRLVPAWSAGTALFRRRFVVGLRRLGRRGR